MASHFFSQLVYEDRLCYHPSYKTIARVSFTITIKCRKYDALIAYSISIVSPLNELPNSDNSLVIVSAPIAGYFMSGFGTFFNIYFNLDFIVTLNACMFF